MGKIKRLELWSKLYSTSPLERDVQNNKPVDFYSTECIARSKRDGTRAETRYGLPAKRTSPFKSVGVSVQLTDGSRGVRISGQQLYRPYCDVQCEAAGYPLHSQLSPSLPLPGVIVCLQVLNALYNRHTVQRTHEGERRHLMNRLRFKDKTEKSGGVDVSVCTSTPSQGVTYPSFGAMAKQRQHHEQARNITGLSSNTLDVKSPVHTVSIRCYGRR